MIPFKPGDVVVRYRAEAGCLLPKGTVGTVVNCTEYTICLAEWEQWLLPVEDFRLKDEHVQIR